MRGALTMRFLEYCVLFVRLVKTLSTLNNIAAADTLHLSILVINFISGVIVAAGRFRLLKIYVFTFKDFKVFRKAKFHVIEKIADTIFFVKYKSKFDIDYYISVKKWQLGLCDVTVFCKFITLNSSTNIL